MFYVYILYSEKFDSFYIGQSQDHVKRLNTHNAGMVKSTRNYRPWVNAWVTEKSTRSEAMQLEKKLKNLNRKRLLEFIKKYS